MQYVISMTSRMVTIAACCVLLLCVLLFLLGFEIGARFVAPPAPLTAQSVAPTLAITPAPATAPEPPAGASSPSAGETDAAPASSTS
ncbi:hypothetical protein [Pararobbsia alpina]|uniref:Uncharacterized protein n=1 Tax=Pararobbsia alpina TaxID=621374 RepID=A0A6S7CI39_9BURK|nr:hypothetical protein [Pararobbsia alpina]CAB3780641.1 hypothetical protein LMG28138_01088 [Pararobbsia alpina]